MKRARSIASVLFLATLVAGGILVAGGTAEGGRKAGREIARPKFATLLGANEVDEAGKRGAGDAEGRGSATVLVPDDDTICFAIVVIGIADPVGAHIHQAKAGANGAIVVPLTPPTPGAAGTSSGCVDGVDAAVINGLRKSPERFYVNVHTPDYPDGALRGQLHCTTVGTRCVLPAE